MTLFAPGYLDYDFDEVSLSAYSAWLPLDMMT